MDNIDEMEKKYQKLISNHSPAYLNWCDWYVGPSLKEYIYNQIDIKPFMIFMLMLNEISKYNSH